MTRIRQWTRSLAIKLYDLAAEHEEQEFWHLEKQAQDATFWMRKYRAVTEDLEGLEAALAELQAPKPVAKKTTRKKKAT